MFLVLKRHLCLLNFCFHAERSFCFKKGGLKVFFAEQRPAVGRKETGIKTKIPRCQNGCAPGLQPRGSSAGRGTSDLGATVPPLKGCKSMLQKRDAAADLLRAPESTTSFIFPKLSLIFPLNPSSSPNSLPAGMSPPAASAPAASTPCCDPLAGRCHCNREITDYLEEKRADDIEILLSVSVTLQKWVSPKEKLRRPVLQLSGVLFAMQEMHNLFKAN